MFLRFTPFRRQLTASPGMILEINEFLRRHIGFIAQTEYGVSSNTALVDNRFSGVGTHPSLLTIQSVRMGAKLNKFPHRGFHEEQRLLSARGSPSRGDQKQGMGGEEGEDQGKAKAKAKASTTPSTV